MGEEGKGERERKWKGRREEGRGKRDERSEKFLDKFLARIVR